MQLNAYCNHYYQGNHHHHHSSTTVIIYTKLWREEEGSYSSRYTDC